TITLTQASTGFSENSGVNDKYYGSSAASFMGYMRLVVSPAPLLEYLQRFLVKRYFCLWCDTFMILNIDLHLPFTIFPLHIYLSSRFSQSTPAKNHTLFRIIGRSNINLISNIFQITYDTFSAFIWRFLFLCVDNRYFKML